MISLFFIGIIFVVISLIISNILKSRFAKYAKINFEKNKLFELIKVGKLQEIIQQLFK